MHAQEQDDGPPVVVAFHAGQGVQALAGEAFGEQRQVVGDRAVQGELVVAGVQEPFDGLGAECAGELLGQAAGGGEQCVLLIDGQVQVAVGLRHGSLLGGMDGGCQPLDAVGDVDVGVFERLVAAGAYRVGDGPVQSFEVGELLVGGVADGHDQVVWA